MVWQGPSYRASNGIRKACRGKVVTQKVLAEIHFHFTAVLNFPQLPLSPSTLPRHLFGQLTMKAMTGTKDDGNTRVFSHLRVHKILRCRRKKESQGDSHNTWLMKHTQYVPPSVCCWRHIRALTEAFPLCPDTPLPIPKLSCAICWEMDAKYQYLLGFCFAYLQRFWG